MSWAFTIFKVYSSCNIIFYPAAKYHAWVFKKKVKSASKMNEPQKKKVTELQEITMSGGGIQGVMVSEKRWTIWNFLRCAARLLTLDASAFRFLSFFFSPSPLISVILLGCCQWSNVCLPSQTMMQWNRKLIEKHYNLSSKGNSF